MTEQQAFARLSTLCSQAEHSSGEMREKMRRWLLDNDAQDRVMQLLIDGHYIDDERFCRAFVHDKVQFDRWGRRKIEQALYKKGVDRSTMSRVLDAVDDSEYIDALSQLMAAKRKAISADSDYELNGRLIKYALGRGFGFDIIKKCIDAADEYNVSDDDI